MVKNKATNGKNTSSEIWKTATIEHREKGQITGPRSWTDKRGPLDKQLNTVSTEQ